MQYLLRDWENAKQRKIDIYFERREKMEEIMDALTTW